MRPFSSRYFQILEIEHAVSRFTSAPTCLFTAAKRPPRVLSSYPCDFRLSAWCDLAAKKDSDVTADGWATLGLHDGSASGAYFEYSVSQDRH